ncbi:MAG: FMN-binding glutamate synthase family protein, partial [Deltaproteobacteria bacterium]|nr:FMN-binding glutamate synthase family protein [Deltaproteobacteria bacterium]
MESKIRLLPIIVTIVLGALCLIFSIISWWFLLPLLVLVPVIILGLWDLRQPKHSILHNYPILGHFRYVIEAFGPPLRQYVIENNKDGAPFNRDLRSLVYQRAKNIEAKKPFGTELDVYAPGYVWVNHSMSPAKVNQELPRVNIGGDQCSQPFSASLLNISAMSFGSLSANAIMALNKGAALGHFYHTTGEGGISPYHRKFNGDLNWQIGSGYFGCRQSDGSFCPDQFAEQANIDQVKMIEIKLSQGAKPGHGGILPAAKITAEIAATRG